MVKRDETLGRLDALNKKYASENVFKWNRKLYKDKGRRQPFMNLNEGENILEMIKSGEGSKHKIKEAQAIAYHLLKYPYPASFLLGAQIYEALGKGERVIPRLLKATESAYEGRNKPNTSQYEEIKSFIERNTSEGGLERSTTALLFLTLGGIALGVGSLSITGNVISNLTTTTPGILGVLLFIGGLVGTFFSLKK